MPALLLSDKTAAVLQALARRGDGQADGALAELQSQLEVPPRPAQEGERYPPGTVVQHKCLVRLSKWAAANSDVSQADLRLSTLLRGAQVAVPVQLRPVRSPELIETLRRIQRAHEEAEYNEMIAPSHGSGVMRGDTPFGFRTSKEKQSPWQTSTNRTEKEEWDEVRRQLGAMLNVGLSVVAVAAATWWAGGNADPIWKTLVAMPLSLLVAVAEVSLYARHWDNVQKKKGAGSQR